MSEPRDPTARRAADGTEHDAWLREALRHAPDAQVSPPANVSHAILSEARSQVRVSQGAQPRARAAANPLQSFWSWLARPPVAAGFASVMAATLVGMMWWDRPMDEAMPKAPPRVGSVPSAAAPPTAPPVTAPSTAPVTAPEALPPASSMAPLQAAPARDSGVRRPEPLKQEDARESARASSAAPRAETPPAETPRAKTPPAETPPAEPPRAAAPSAFPASPVMRRLARAASALEAETRLAELQDARVEPAAQPVPKDRAGSNVFAVTPPAPPGAARTDNASGMLAAKAAAPRARPLAPLLVSLRDDAARWRRAGGARPVEPDAALVGWLAELDAASAGLWVTTDSAARAHEAAGVSALELQRDGAPVASLRFEGDAFLLETHGHGSARIWRAELPATAAERLRARLPRLPP